MTVQLLGSIYSYQGTSTDDKPTIGVVTGSQYRELDTSRQFQYDGGIWNRQYDLSRVGLQSRIVFSVATSIVSYSTTFNAYGKALTGYLAEVGTNGNTSQTRTFTLSNADGITLWSTDLAIYTDTGITTTLGMSTVYTMSPNIPVDGTYTIALSISTNTTVVVTDALTFFFQA